LEHGAYVEEDVDPPLPFAAGDDEASRREGMGGRLVILASLLGAAAPERLSERRSGFDDEALQGRNLATALNFMPEVVRGPAELLAHDADARTKLLLEFDTCWVTQEKTLDSH
jgi:hypothetical protein